MHFAITWAWQDTQKTTVETTTSLKNKDRRAQKKKEQVSSPPRILAVVGTRESMVCVLPGARVWLCTLHWLDMRPESASPPAQQGDYGWRKAHFGCRVEDGRALDARPANKELYRPPQLPVL